MGGCCSSDVVTVRAPTPVSEGEYRRMGVPVVLRVHAALLAARRREEAMRPEKRARLDPSEQVVMTFQAAPPAPAAETTVPALQADHSAAARGDAPAVARAIQFCLANARVARHLGLGFTGTLTYTGINTLLPPLPNGRVDGLLRIFQSIDTHRLGEIAPADLAPLLSASRES